MFNIDHRIIEEVLTENVQWRLDSAQRCDPFLSSLRSDFSGHPKVRVTADVAEDQPRLAVYDVPWSSCELLQVAPPAELDGLIRWIDDVARMIYRVAAPQFTSDLVHPSDGNFLGLPGLLTRVPGKRIVGEIDETLFRGWRSVVESADACITPQHALARLASACTVAGHSPDLLLVGTNLLAELFETSGGPRIVYVDPTRPYRIPFGRSVIVPGHSCDPNSAYALHTDDFVVQRSPLRVFVEAAGDSSSAVQISINRRHQLIATRRFRSGRLWRRAA